MISWQKSSIILVCALLLCSWVNASVTDGVIVYLACDGDFSDSSGHGNAATGHGGALSNWSPKVGTGACFTDGSNDYFDFPNISSLEFEYNDNFSISMWLNTNKTLASDSNENRFFNDYQNGVPYGWFFQEFTDGTYFKMYAGTGGVRSAGTATKINSGSWVHVLVRNNATATQLWINGSLVATDTTTPNSIKANNLNIAGGRIQAAYTNNAYDEIAIYNRTLDNSEVTQLWNGGNGYNPFLYSLNVTTISPQNGYHANVPVTYEASLNASSAANCTLFINGTSAGTMTNQITGTIAFSNINKTDGAYVWEINCTIGSMNASTGLRNITYDRVVPVWTIRSVAVGNTSVLNPAFAYQFNDTCADTYVYGWNVTIRAPNGSVMYSNESLNLTTDAATVQDSVNMSSWAKGLNYTVTFACSDDHTASEIEQYGVSALKFDDLTKEVTPPGGLDVLTVIEQPLLETPMVIVGDKISVDAEAPGYDTLIYDTPVNAVRITSLDPVKTMDTEHLLDRYSFTFEPVTPTSERSFVVACDHELSYRGNLYPFPSFVCWNDELQSGNWIDFSTYESYPTSVMSNGDGSFSVTVFTDLVSAAPLTFHSVGGLNVVVQQYDFILNRPPLNTWGSQNITVNYSEAYMTASYCSDGDADTLNFSSDDTIFPILSNGSINFSPVFLNQSGAYDVGVNCSDGINWSFGVARFNIFNNCPVNWTCYDYAACTPDNLLHCAQIYDSNQCYLPYTGNGSEFDLNCSFVGGLDCQHPANIYKDEDTSFLCDIGSLAGYRYECFGIVKSMDGSVLSIMPEQTDITDFGRTGGYVAVPENGTEQHVKVAFSNYLLKYDSDTEYMVKCVSNGVAPAEINYSFVARPLFKPRQLPTDIGVGAAQNAGNLTIIGIFLIVVVLAGVALWRFVTQ